MTTYSTTTVRLTVAEVFRIARIRAAMRRSLAK